MDILTLAGSLIGTGLSYVTFTIVVSFIMWNRVRTNREFDYLDMLIMGGIVSSLYIAVGLVMIGMSR